VATEQDRLIASAKLWGTVKYFHPYLAYRDIDWDKALVDALPGIRSAAGPTEYAKVLGSMLDALHDPVTYARIAPAKTFPKPGPAPNSGLAASGQRTWVHFGLAGSAFASRAVPARIETVIIPMGEDVEAVVRLSEPVYPNAKPPYPSPQTDRAYSEPRYPGVEYRILAAFKIWTVIRDFFAYRDLMDEDWDDVFASFLPKFMAAKDAREYNLTVAEMITHESDSNASVKSANLSEYFGEVPLGLRMRLIDKKPVVTNVIDEEAKKAGVRPGEIVTSVDGEDIIQRVNREAKYIAASTQQSLGARVMECILDGQEGATATLTIRGDEEQSKQVTLKRTAAFRQVRTQRSGEAVRTLPGNIGYVDLDRLGVGDVDGVFEKFREMKAIIFDGRGSTHGLGSSLAAHLNAKTDVAAAIVTGPLTLAPDLASNGQLTSTASFFRVEALPAAQSIYKGKTVMLIDERTSGEAEHTGLYLEAANNTAFVGSTSAGVDGEIGNFVVPGGITITYSSTDVRHGNAGKLQRVGLQPAESVSPTLEGIRAGRDEVLERAVEYVAR
jgi:C-terminal processing protease CtpA/Prc